MSKQVNEKISLRHAWKQTMRTLQIFWKQCPQHFIAKTLYTLFSAATPFVTLWFSAQLLNELSGGRDPEELLRLTIWTLSSALVLGLITAALNRWGQYTDEIISAGYFRMYWEKFLDLDFVDADSQSVYDLYTQIKHSTNYMGWGPYQVIFHLEATIKCLFQLIGGVALTVSLFTAKVPASSSLAFLGNPLCAVGIIAVMLLTAYLASACITRAQKIFSKTASLGSFGNRMFAHVMTAPEDRDRALDMRIYDQFENVCKDAFDNNNAFSPTSELGQMAKKVIAPLEGLSKIISMSLTGFIYLFVCLKASAGAFGIGSVTQYVGASTTLFLAITDLLEILGILYVNVSYLDKTFEYLDIPNRMYQGSLTTEKRSDRQYEIEFRDVSFRYPGSEQYALRHVNMKFRVGSRLAVVGQNGSGKTTFIKLLCRLYDPTEGKILLNGIDIRKYRYDDYMQIFSVVFQDFKLLSLPLGQNVAASREYDAARVTDCLKKAGFAEKLAAMPKDLDTFLYKDMDTDGVEVSGGEAQKIAIARALYKDAPFIILDEPTAALDPIAEAEIYEKFNDIAGDKTAIYISHRLSSCKFCDEIAVFDNGQIVQQGTHDALVSDESGKYHELWNAQAQYYTEHKEEVPA